jgi:hypothetical protein
MPRIPTAPQRSDFSGDDLELYDDAMTRVAGWRAEAPSVHKPIPYWGAMLNSPPIAARQSMMGSTVRGMGERDGSYSHADREWVDQVLGYLFDYFGVTPTHTPDAVAVGVRLDAMIALHEGRDEDLTDDERLLKDYIHMVVSGKVTDEAYDAIEQRLGKRGAVEYTYFIAYLQMVLRLHMAFGVRDPGREEAGKVLYEFRDGKRDVLPDWEHRLG